jgi:hypothetical protein
VHGVGACLTLHRVPLPQVQLSSQLHHKCILLGISTTCFNLPLGLVAAFNHHQWRGVIATIVCPGWCGPGRRGWSLWPALAGLASLAVHLSMHVLLAGLGSTAWVMLLDCWARLLALIFSCSTVHML